MGMSRLTIQEMSQITLPWVTVGEAARTAIEKNPLLASLLPPLLQAHESTYALRAQTDDPRSQFVSEQLAALDGRHDDLIRGMHGVLTSLALVSDAPEEILDVRDFLFPDGLAHIKMTYRGEAEHAAQIVASMDDRYKARLQTITLYKTNLLNLTLEWLDVAKQLGALEEARSRMIPLDAATAAEICSTRFAWMRVVNAVIANAKLAELDPDTDQLLFSALRTAIQIADVRGSRTLEQLGKPTGSSTKPNSDA